MSLSTRRAAGRFWLLFALLFALIVVEGGVGLYVLADFKDSVEALEAMQNAGMRIDAFGLLLNNFVKEMKVSTGMSAAGGQAVPLPATVGLLDSAARLAALKDAVRSPELERLLLGTRELGESVAAYGRDLAAAQSDEATLRYIQTIEPLSDRLMAQDFPATRTAILAGVERVSAENRAAGALARRILILSLLGTLAVGALIARLIWRSFQAAKAQDQELDRRASELAIARSIQTSVLPRDFHLPGFEVAATMVTADEIGGDFYEFRRTADGGAWLAMGDVTGHGVRAGLVMLMAQSMFMMLCEEDAAASSPGRLLERLNRTLYYNLKDRLGEDKLMTMVVARLFPDGRMLYAGAHTDLLHCHGPGGAVERLPTEGLWLGMVEDLAGANADREIQLAPGDVALFHTDGVTEGRNATGEQFDVERLAERLREAASAGAAAVVAAAAGAARAWSPVLADDLSLLAVARARGEREGK